MMSAPLTASAGSAEAEARVDSNMDASVDEVVCGDDAGSSASVLRVLWRGACDEPAL